MAKKATAKTEKPAAAAEVDEVLGTKKSGGKKSAADDVLEGKSKKGGGKKAAPAKKGGGKKAKAAESVGSEAIREYLRKCRKLTSYADVAEATGADLRQVRRTSRAMRDDGELEIVKEGTVCFVKKA